MFSYFWSDPKPSSDPSSSDIDEEKEESLEDKLFHLDLSKKNVAIIIEQGQKYLNHPEALAKRLSIDVNGAKEALDAFKACMIEKISGEKIQEFELLVKNNPLESLEEIALSHAIDEDVVSAYIALSDRLPLTECEKVSIKERLDDGSSITKIAEELKLSQKKINEYVRNKFILFNGEEGEKVLAIINEQFGKYSTLKLRELILKKDLDLQEKIRFELLKKNESEYIKVKNYFTKFEESQNFFKIDRELSTADKVCIRSSSLDYIRELRIKLNKMERVIRNYLLQYSPDGELMFDFSQEQFKRIQNIRAAFLTDIQISHTTYRMIISDSSETLMQNAKNLSGSPKKVFAELLPLAFYYQKCSLPLEVITRILTKMTKISLTTLDIFHLIFQMSDPVVRGLCIEHYSFSNPVPFYYPILISHLPEQTACKFEICKELWYSLQQFSGLVSFGLGWASWNPVGKSHLLDLMFGTDFVKGSPQNSPFHLGSIDIQMTKNLFGERVIGESTQWAYIDCHGWSDVNVIYDVYQNLDIVLIHVSYSDYRENYTRLEANLYTITVNNKHVYVLIRDYKGNDVITEQVTLDCNFATFIFIPNLINRDEILFVDLREIGYKILHSKDTSSKLVESNFLETMITRYGCWDNMRVEKELIESVMNNIHTKIQNKSKVDISSLSYYPHFVEYMRCYYEASSQTDQKIIDELNEKCERLANHLENAEMSAIVWQFNEILSQENSTLILWKLSQELNLLSKQVISGNNKTPFTLEFLWREALLSSKYNVTQGKSKQVSKYFDTFSSNLSNHVERGEPFELIDGDNLRFFNQDINVLLSKFYEKQFNQVTKIINKQRPPIVVSIFGPQSSGKSTLLNYCFGCKFLTSAGRCTKGIYASLSKLSRPINNSDHFLILDTEGLDAIEKGRTIQDTSCIHFDRTMVLFCLAVSQVVIINVKGDIGEEMRNLLQICAYSLNKLKVSKVAAPKIFFVLNQQADPDPVKHLSSINTLLEKLNKESHLMETEGLKISDLIQVSKRNLYVLQSAFNSQSLNAQMTKVFDSVLCKLSPTTSFADKCADLRMSIIHQLRDDTSNNESPFNTLSEWLEMSGVIWDTIVKYQDIVKYRNVEELESSNKLRKIVSGLMKNIIYFNTDKYREITEKLTHTIKDITKWKSPKVILENVKGGLEDKFEEYQEEALKDFAEHCQTDPLLKKMDYMCDDARSNLRRLIYIEKKIYEDKLKFEIRAKLTEIKLKEKMTTFQEAIEKNADRYLELSIEEQKREFGIIWLSCFSNDTKEEEETDIDEIFDDLYSVFRMESKTMENKSTIYTLFRQFNFEMDTAIKILGETILLRFCDESNKFAGTDQFFYPWRENREPLKDMAPYPGRGRYEYLSKESLYVLEVHNKRSNIVFRKFVPQECHPLIKYCSGYFNHPDIIWNPVKRKQILLLASKLKDPANPGRSAWEKLIADISKRVQEFTRSDQTISHSTVREIVDFLSRICKLVNYEINFIEAKLTNAAERMISTLAFAFAFKSVLNAKLEKQREEKLSEKKRKETDLKYFLQKVKNRKSARGGWERKEMREGDLIMASKFATDFLAALFRGVSTAFEPSINEEYFDKEANRFSHKNILLLANERVTEELRYSTILTKEEKLLPLNFYFLNMAQKLPFPVVRPDIPNIFLKDLPDTNQSIDENNFVVQFICNRIQTLKNIFQEEWAKLSIGLYRTIVGNMKIQFTKQIETFKYILENFLERLEYMCKEKDRLLEVGTDSDSNFEVAKEAATEQSALEAATEQSALETATKESALETATKESALEAATEQSALEAATKESALEAATKESATEVATEQSITEAVTTESGDDPNPKIREAPFKAMALFLEMYLNPRVSPKEFNEFFTGVFEVDGVDLIKHHDTYVLLEKPYNPTQMLDEDMFQKLSDTNMFKSTETIFNIKVYVQEFLRTLNCYEYKVTLGEYEKILKATKEQFEAHIINCSCKCPSCGKFCEKEIHPQEDKCQILTGHQICSMGGNVWNTNKDKTAILLMCEDYMDDTPVLIPGQKMKWWDFKEKCDQWDWSLPTDEEYVTLQEENRDRMEMIWNKFGRGILKYYASRGTLITYIPYTSPEEIYESLFDLKYYVCIVIDGTDLMDSAMNRSKNWVSDLMDNTALGGTPYFRIIIYHGHAVSEKECVETFPNNSEFTTDTGNIQDFLNSMITYGGDGNESAMLHGLATATTQSDWKSGFGVRNIISHFYCEPTEGYFDIFNARGKCEKGCPFDWKRDIRDKIDELNVNYRHISLIRSTHPYFTGKSPIGYKVPSELTLNSEKKSKPKKDIFINYQAEN